MTTPEEQARAEREAFRKRVVGLAADEAERLTKDLKLPKGLKVEFDETPISESEQRLLDGNR